MKKRFEAADQLVRALRGQTLIAQDEALAAAIAAAGQLQEFASGDVLIEQGTSDNDIYFLLLGSVAILVHGANVGMRKGGQTVGEMSAIEPSLPRSATVRAAEPTVALKVSNERLHAIADSYPKLWAPLAQELARRLYQRNDTITRPNHSPKLFIISSTEAKEIAHTLRAGLEHDVFSTVWDQGVFWAGGYPLEALERQVAESDFAVAIAEPDDIVDSRGVRAPTLRDNVLFELGLFMGKLTRHRSILLCPRMKGLKLPSDLQGLTLISYEIGSAPIADRLAPACEKVREVVRRLGVKVFE